MHNKKKGKGRNPGEGETCYARTETGKKKETSIHSLAGLCLSLRYNEGEETKIKKTGKKKAFSFFFLFFFLREFLSCRGDGKLFLSSTFFFLFLAGFLSCRGDGGRRRMCGPGAELGFFFSLPAALRVSLSLCVFSLLFSFSFCNDNNLFFLSFRN